MNRRPIPLLAVLGVVVVVLVFGVFGLVAAPFLLVAVGLVAHSRMLVGTAIAVGVVYAVLAVLLGAVGGSVEGGGGFITSP